MLRTRRPGGRALWPLLLLALAVWVTSDFIRYPFVGDRSTVAQPPRLAVWAASSVGGADAEQALARRLARGLERNGTPAVIVPTTRGSAATVRRFFTDAAAPAERLLVLTSTLVTDLARDRRDRLVPGAALEATVAAKLLREATPIADLGSDPLAFAVAAKPDGAGDRDGAALLRRLRAAPADGVVAIGDDTWSKAQLAAFVDRAGIHGNLRFSTYSTVHEAVAAVRRGEARAALATRAALLRERRRGGVAVLGWPAELGPAPRAWSLVVAPGSTRAGEAASLRRRVARLRLARASRAPLARRFGDARLLAAQRLVATAARVTER